MKTIIFDIDSTLANINHRLPLIRPSVGMALRNGVVTKVLHMEKEVWLQLHGGPTTAMSYKKAGFTPNWDRFHEEAVYDVPIAGVVKLARIYLSLDYDVRFITGRMEKGEHRQITLDWLQDHVSDLIEDRHLHMRAYGDYRSDDIIKEEVLLTLGSETVEMVFEDRQRVVDMYRRNGLTVAQVDRGDF